MIVPAVELVLLANESRALARYGDAVGVEVLLARIGARPTRGADGGFAEGLGAFRSGVDPRDLVEVLLASDQRSSARAAVAAALGRLAHPDADRWSVDLRRAVPFPLRTPNQVNADGAGVLQWL